MDCVIVNEGKKVPLGSLKRGTIEVPAFGPQLYPLNEPESFGVHRMEGNWSVCSAQKEIWLEHRVNESGLEVRFIGSTSISFVAFVFFVKADCALLEDKLYLPKSLERYCSNAKQVQFKAPNSCFSITNLFSTKMDLIPLAGSGCFWGSDFLLAFDVPVHDGKIAFQFH